MNDPGLLREARDQQAREEELREASRAWRDIVRRRVVVAAVLVAAWAAAIEARLVYLQVFQHDELSARAERQRNRTIPVSGKRGELVDRNGRVLAYTVDGDAIFAEPGLLTDADEVTARVCRVLEGCTETERQQMLERVRQRRAFAYLRRLASPTDAERVRALKIHGVGILKEPRRYYPHNSLAAHVVGYVGLDNTGLGGVERSHDREIRGEPGLMLLQTDAKGTAFGRIQKTPTAGAALELTIDAYLQLVCERELAEGVRENGAAGGTALIMAPATGDVLALCNVPTFNPNAYQATPDDHRRNRAVQEAYEPGSTFKTVTASAALEERLVAPGEIFDVSQGYIRIGARTIEDVHRYGALSFTDGIVKSSNVLAIKVGLRVGAERLGRYVARFGFGQLALRDLPGESRGIVWNPAQWSDSALASVSMGYQIGVTPIQMATAVNAIATGGQLVAPRVVRATVRNGVRQLRPPVVVRRAVSPDTAATLTTIMESVVERGTAKAARIEGYTIAGKTGTAAKLENGRYSRSDYNASFVGFIPSRRPAVTVLVVIDTPRAKGYFGGSVAAPVFKRMAEATLRHLGVGPNLQPAPPVLVARADESRTPSISPTVGRGRRVVAIRAGSVPAGDVMPDLRGLSARDAIRTLAHLGIIVRLTGSGLVVDQEIPAGSPVERGMTCALRLDRQLPVADDEPTQ